MNLAPIVLFVYNRPWHTEQTLNALSNNYLANESTLYIFSDGPKPDATKEEKEKIDEVRNLISSKQWCKEVHIVYSDINKGLARSIIDGVTEIINEYGRIIVLEDDIITSKNFLKYMNYALNLYEKHFQVWHITGYSTPVYKEGLKETFFTKYMCCWGWGTWKDRWSNYQKKTDELILSFTEKMKFDFNYGKGNEFFGQIELNKDAKIDTWAIYWYATIFKHNGLCLNPSTSFVQNIGNDGTGINCGTFFDNVEISNTDLNYFEMDIRELSETRKKFQDYFLENYFHSKISVLLFLLHDASDRHNALRQEHNALRQEHNALRQEHNALRAALRNPIKWIFAKLFSKKKKNENNNVYYLVMLLSIFFNQINALY